MIVETPQLALNQVSEGIALLIDLAKRGEIDPWDVQVIDVIDRYLSQLTPQQDSSPSQNFTELSQSGQAFLYASMLVLLKAESLMALEAEEAEEELILEEELIEGENGLDPLQRPKNLEHQIRRRVVGKAPQKRRVTLQELIDQLQLMATAIADQKTHPKRRRTSKQAQAARAIAELAHQENLTETATKLEQLLNEHWSSLTQDWLDLEQLLVMWEDAKPTNNNTKPLEMAPIESESSDETNLVHQPQNDRVGVFWALLLLSAQSKVELSQEEFYQDLKIRTLPTADSVPS